MHAYVHSINTTKCLHTYIHAIFACKHLFMCKYIVLIQTCAYVHTNMRVKIHSCKYILEYIHKFIYTYARTYIHGAKIPNKCTPTNIRTRSTNTDELNHTQEISATLYCLRFLVALPTQVSSHVSMHHVIQKQITCISVPLYEWVMSCKIKLRAVLCRSLSASYKTARF